MMSRLHPDDALFALNRKECRLILGRSAFLVLLIYSAALGRVVGEVQSGSRPFGDLAGARIRTPELFTPGVVTSVDIAKTPSYLICITTSRDFPDEKDEELLQGLELNAKSALLKYITNGKPEGMELEISGLRILYSWKDDVSLSANFGVPIAGVKLSRQPSNPQTGKSAESSGPKKEPESSAPPSITPNNNTATKLNSENDVLSLIDHFRSKKFPELADALAMLDSEKATYTPEAFLIYQRLKQDSSDADALEGLGNLYEKNDKPVQALSHYRMAWRIFDTKSPGKAEALAYKVAVMTDSMKESAEALDCYEKFLQQYSTSKHLPSVIKRIGQLRSKTHLQSEPPKP